MVDDSKTPKEVTEDAKKVANESVTKLREVASDTKAVASDAVDTAKSYAKSAVNATGQKLSSMNEQISDCCHSVVNAINRDPMKAVLVTAAVSAAVTALAIALCPRSERSHY